MYFLDFFAGVAVCVANQLERLLRSSAKVYFVWGWNKQALFAEGIVK